MAFIKVASSPKKYLRNLGLAANTPQEEAEMFSYDPPDVALLPKFAPPRATTTTTSATTAPPSDPMSLRIEVLRIVQRCRSLSTCVRNVPTSQSTSPSAWPSASHPSALFATPFPTSQPVATNQSVHPPPHSASSITNSAPPHPTTLLDSFSHSSAATVHNNNNNNNNNNSSSNNSTYTPLASSSPRHFHTPTSSHPLPWPAHHLDSRNRTLPSLPPPPVERDRRRRDHPNSQPTWTPPPPYPPISLPLPSPLPLPPSLPIPPPLSQSLPPLVPSSLPPPTDAYRAPLYSARPSTSPSQLLPTSTVHVPPNNPIPYEYPAPAPLLEPSTIQARCRITLLDTSLPTADTTAVLCCFQQKCCIETIENADSDDPPYANIYLTHPILVPEDNLMAISATTGRWEHLAHVRLDVEILPVSTDHWPPLHMPIPAMAGRQPDTRWFLLATVPNIYHPNTPTYVDVYLHQYCRQAILRTSFSMELDTRWVYSKNPTRLSPLHAAPPSIPSYRPDEEPGSDVDGEEEDKSPVERQTHFDTPRQTPLEKKKADPRADPRTEFASDFPSLSSHLSPTPPYPLSPTTNPKTESPMRPPSRMLDTTHDSTYSISRKRTCFPKSISTITANPRSTGAGATAGAGACPLLASTKPQLINCQETFLLNQFPELLSTPTPSTIDHLPRPSSSLSEQRTRTRPVPPPFDASRPGVANALDVNATETSALQKYNLSVISGAVYAERLRYLVHVDHVSFDTFRCIVCGCMEASIHQLQAHLQAFHPQFVFSMSEHNGVMVCSMNHAIPMVSPVSATVSASVPVSIDTSKEEGLPGQKSRKTTVEHETSRAGGIAHRSPPSVSMDESDDIESIRPESPAVRDVFQDFRESSTPHTQHSSEEAVVRKRNLTHFLYDDASGVTEAIREDTNQDSLGPQSPSRVSHISPTISSASRASSDDFVEPAPYLPGKPSSEPFVAPNIKQTMYDPISKTPIAPGELVYPPRSDDTWWIQKHRDMINDYSDLSPAEREYIVRWVEFVLPYRLTSDIHLPPVWLEFVRTHAAWILDKPHRLPELMIHAAYLQARDVLDYETHDQALTFLDRARHEKKRKELADAADAKITEDQSASSASEPVQPNNAQKASSLASSSPTLSSSDDGERTQINVGLTAGKASTGKGTSKARGVRDAPVITNTTAPSTSQSSSLPFISTNTVLSTNAVSLSRSTISPSTTKTTPSFTSTNTNTTPPILSSSTSSTSSSTSVFTSSTPSLQSSTSLATSSSLSPS